MAALNVFVLNSFGLATLVFNNNSNHLLPCWPPKCCRQCLEGWDNNRIIASPSDSLRVFAYGLHYHVLHSGQVSVLFSSILQHGSFYFLHFAVNIPHSSTIERTLSHDLYIFIGT